MVNFPAADPADLILRDSQEILDPFHPLVLKLPRVDDDEGWLPPPGDSGQGDDRLPGSRWATEVSRIPPQNIRQGGLLNRASKFP
jgi:hypothetical protein